MHRNISSNKSESIFSNAKRDLHPIVKIILFIPMLIFLIFVLSLIKGTVLKVNGNKELINNIIFFISSIFTIIVSNKLLNSISVKNIGLKIDNNSIKNISTGFLVGLSIILTFFIIELAFNWIVIVGFAWEFRNVTDILNDLLLIIGYTLLGAASEEILFRGYLLQMLERFLNIKYAILASSLIFASIHLLNPGTGGWMNIVIIISHTLAGIILCLAFIERKSLWKPIGIHFAWNLMEYKVLALVGVRPEQSIFLTTEVVGPKLLVGIPNSAFGAETSLVGISVMLIIIYIYTRVINKQYI